MKWPLIGTLAIAGMLLCAAGRQPVLTPCAAHALNAFRADAAAFSDAATALRSSVGRLRTGDTAALGQARRSLADCRLKYKRIEYFMEYFFEYPVNLYNRAPAYEVEEPYMEYQAPVGLQVVEGLLYEDDVNAHKKELADQCEVIAATARDIPAILYALPVTDAQVLEAMRLELIRIMTLGITGYDAPLLKSGIRESAAALRSIALNLTQLPKRDPGRMDSLGRYLQQAIALLEAHPEFDGFDRLGFLTDAVLPLQEQLGLLIREQGMELNTHAAVSHRASNLFSREAIDLAAFSSTDSLADQAALIRIGKELFHERRLSGNGQRSCASCHQPEKSFTDGLVKSRTLDGRGEVTRNAPTLYYAAYQHIQFYDGRAASLEEQIGAVLRNPLEMDIRPEDAAARLNDDPHYAAAFRQAYKTEDGPAAVTATRIAHALAAYERTLAPFSSLFDRYMAGERQALNERQRKGFNLFMGKAQCGTCHFAPLFNGLLPPGYERTELEVLGVPRNSSRRHPRADTDSGRYSFFQISFHKGAFKTTTVRNSAVTAPYMHNGVFRTLEEVVDFYNNGGGRGLKLEVENQTLSDRPLHLSREERKDIVAFLHALTDRPVPY